MNVKRERIAEKKLKIVNTAKRLSKHKRFDDVSMHAVSKACKINHASIYLYFKGKNELVRWSYKAFCIKLQWLVNSRLEFTGREQLHFICNQFIHQVNESPGFMNSLLPEFYGVSAAERSKRLTVEEITALCDGITLDEAKKVIPRGLELLILDAVKQCYKESKSTSGFEPPAKAALLIYSTLLGSAIASYATRGNIRATMGQAVSYQIDKATPRPK